MVKNKKYIRVLFIIGVIVAFISMIGAIILKSNEPIKIDTNNATNNPKIILEENNNRSPSNDNNSSSSSTKKKHTLNTVKKYDGNNIILSNNKIINTKDKVFFGDKEIKPNSQISQGKLNTGEEYIVIYNGIKVIEKMRTDVKEKIYIYTAKITDVADSKLKLDNNTELAVDINCTIQKVSNNSIMEYSKAYYNLSDHIGELMLYKNKIINIVIYD
ncbi:hypothetical protein N494_18970 (plasmid) [Clostridium botulinum A2B7 92]|uniref:hypothetical protein n=1 Tax=Clostridium botulinum TaxID=1491 RepID=UPI0007DF5F52|nr:hypothetical protein [Clostridium botulinum]KEI94193.1 hypothetical protein N494_18970 [Clostridium botulinum A2B7 92]